ncbi:peptidase M14 [Kordiimonas sediminis]|uniref:Peptidase M14 n=1 Tax=Kordiimonas sediminis TaxID=1735581 RepID=A0A919APZ7_9PROT|nr:M14-type cytosolic carboxypeptidase [Kordiimonas sediminis]GHF17639.1 peptidase M14 [Kordiimonas sediminis]
MPRYFTQIRISSLFILAAMMVLAPPLSAKSTETATGKITCASKTITLRTDFPGGQARACSVSDDGAFTLTIGPEDEPPINPSPWYAFKLKAAEASPVQITLSYQHGWHRYWPKVSTDGKVWTKLSADNIVAEKEQMQMTLPAFTGDLYVAGQEIIAQPYYLDWYKRLAATSNIQTTVIGQSVEGRDIHKLETAPDGDSRKYIFLVGRQHPPEVTGALAFFPFVETLLGDSALAKEFRQKFGIVMIPLVNPDGVDNGNWRHNMQGQDLNRDWGLFDHPESQAIEQELERFAKQDDIALFLDFHSTNRNVLYTQGDEEETKPDMFARRWSAAAMKRLDGMYELEHAERPSADYTPDQRAYYTSKNYMYRTYGIASITYEVGDKTDRTKLKKAAEVFAEEMMTILLEDLKD